MNFTTSPEERKVAQEQIDTVFSILEDWYQAIEDGTAHHRLPDPTFQAPPGKPAITEDLVDEFIKELDREIDTDAFGSQGRKYGADASSEFHRLDYPQRVALVQQLMRALLSDEEMSKEADELRAQQPTSP
ncbi:MAG: hypothetical protein ACE5JL_00320 [Dehalococcoidia bacterium]